MDSDAQDGPTVRLEEGSGPAKGWDPWIVCRCPMLDDPRMIPKFGIQNHQGHLQDVTSRHNSWMIIWKNE